MIPDTEPRISLSQAAARYPGSRGCDRIHTATLTRWILRGVMSLSGKRVKLEAERIGCRWMTTEAALARFAAALAGHTDDVKPRRSPAEREQAAKAAGRRMQAAGC